MEYFHKHIFFTPNFYYYWFPQWSYAASSHLPLSVIKEAEGKGSVQESEVFGLLLLFMLPLAPGSLEATTLGTAPYSCFFASFAPALPKSPCWPCVRPVTFAQCREDNLQSFLNLWAGQPECLWLKSPLLQPVIVSLLTFLSCSCYLWPQCLDSHFLNSYLQVKHPQESTRSVQENCVRETYGKLPSTSLHSPGYTAPQQNLEMSGTCPHRAQVIIPISISHFSSALQAPATTISQSLLNSCSQCVFSCTGCQEF